MSSDQIEVFWYYALHVIKLLCTAVSVLKSGYLGWGTAGFNSLRNVENRGGFGHPARGDQVVSLWSTVKHCEALWSRGDQVVSLWSTRLEPAAALCTVHCEKHWALSSAGRNPAKWWPHCVLAEGWNPAQRIEDQNPHYVVATQHTDKPGWTTRTTLCLVYSLQLCSSVTNIRYNSVAV